jgi:hypothetical protein
LIAEAHLLLGNEARAVTAAREALRLMAEQNDVLIRHLVLISSTVVFAWSGAEDEAVGFLEQLASVNAGLAPAEITRDPLYSVPLADNPRYQALSARLEAQIAATVLR